MAMQKTLVLVKPDGVKRALAGEIISRFERKGLKVAALKMMQFDAELAERHYEAHVSKPFFPDLKAFITSGPIVAMVIVGDEAIGVVRQMMGATKFTEALPGTVRGDYAFSTTENLVHGSDSPEAAEREIGLFFNDAEIFA